MISSAERDWLAQLEFFGIKLGLENIEALLAADGNPQHACPVVHVAGTNGKGSTLAFLDAMLRAAGYHTGRFTSPHLLDVTERFLVSQQPVDAQTLDAHLTRCRQTAARLQRTPTYFEACTAVAFSLFAEARVDIALIETGMGGRLDSTNVVNPRAVGITTIGLDHMQYLGDTLAEIAAEKAGIIKSGRPVAVGRVDADAAGVIAARAQAEHAPARWLGLNFHAAASGDPWRPELVYTSESLSLPKTPLGLAGLHQADNAALACALAEIIRPDFPRLDEAAMIAGMEKARWPCRLERVCEIPPVILDAAHNPAGMTHYASLFSKAVVVFAASSDKDAHGMLAQLEAFAAPLILTEYPGGRAASAHDLAALCPNAQALPLLDQALKTALQHATPSTPLLVTGSIFLAAAARERLHAWGLAAPLRF